MTDDLRALLTRPVLEVAPALLGRVVEHRTAEGLVAVRLTEVEAYDGPNDPGSHAYRGRTARNAVMFGPPGHLYVYFTYGMHWCINLVCGTNGHASAVLLRAGEVIAGEKLARSRRPAARSARDLARGPARLAQALGVDRAGNGLDAFAPSSPVRLTPGEQVPGTRIRRGPRIGLAAAADWPWRFWVDAEPTVSVYRAHAPKRRRTAAEPPAPTSAAPDSGTLGVEAATAEPSIRPRKEPR
ncbi:DNA-3-methyladenine glycosylase [Actinopolymorpha rutila]|uniref:Putative 3-methyladenine DNA glycosylase n=1 Tax=Actinopolymorpha rutila TaxID=446787 RepID=A0A852ZDP2_9ACTN|nr:DNA-3-methyladenine glycosylase [Actinopolymorpha rutila]NYH90305.1 DNA-3-methyladenine glycosylase [Actinopolymorpha rutila]